MWTIGIGFVSGYGGERYHTRIPKYISKRVSVAMTCVSKIPWGRKWKGTKMTGIS